jgi:hypothetical protein
VIDDDIGISGSGTHRPGFERLLRALCSGQLGAVFSIEASRLARNGRDWHTLLEFCSVVGALLIDAETLYDARVGSTIDLIFRKFAELGSVRQVFFWLDQQRIQLPSARGPEAVRETVWQPARYHAVLSVLKNPAYAGAYAYGRSNTTVRLEDGQKRISRQKQSRPEDWTVLIMDHHEGYIDWDVYQSNQTMIAHNNNGRGAAVRGSVKHGGALLAGLLRCGHCGAKLLAQYPGPGSIRYQCSGYLAITRAA